MRTYQSVLFFILALTLNSCLKEDDSSLLDYSKYNYFIFDDIDGWQFTPANLPSDTSLYNEYEPSMFIQEDWVVFSEDENAPTQTTGLVFSINNQDSTEVFPFIINKMTGLKPSTSYKVDLRTQFSPIVLNDVLLSDLNANVKLGISTSQPTISDDNGILKPNFERATDLDNDKVILLDEIVFNPTNIEISNLHTSEIYETLEIETDENGEFWLWIGIESSAYGKHGLFIDDLAIFYKEL
ncbi:hypothetical protein [Sediminitomix flava]|uniref:Uncharacterized protein n=1 Tax=Sediminitomix flava TaxID=379075 RepID=A0A315ZXB7_SEDFL|nr:hypothetical protein [Sediminitomix flava]PWJ41987.1 hypothetical protein BC781_103237 [Sediminitomix flava]